MAVTSATAPAALLPASPVCKLSATQTLPSLQRLGAPDPHATGDAHHQRHEDLQHEHGHGGHRRFQRAVLVPPTRECGALALEPSEFPVVHVEPLVEVANDDAGGRNRVQDGVDADFHHQLFQLFRVGAFGLHHLPDVEKRHEAGQDERRPNDEITGQRHEDEAC